MPIEIPSFVNRSFWVPSLAPSLLQVFMRVCVCSVMIGARSFLHGGGIILFACYCCCCCCCSCLVFPSYRSFVQRRCSVGPLGRTHTHTPSLTHSLTHSLTRPEIYNSMDNVILLSCFPQSQGKPRERFSLLLLPLFWSFFSLFFFPFIHFLPSFN